MFEYKEIKETVVPSALKEGDTIGIIAPASAPDMKQLSMSANRLSKMGYKISLGPNIRKLVQRNSLRPLQKIGPRSLTPPSEMII